MYKTKIEEDYITRNLLNTKERLPDSVAGMNYQQLSLFDDVNFTGNQIVTPYTPVPLQNKWLPFSARPDPKPEISGRSDSSR